MATLKQPKQSKNNMEEVTKAIEAAEEDNIRTLEDEFEIGEDGCVHDVPMLAGYVDDNGVLHSTFTYREMTGKDEEAINRGDVKANGAKVVNIIVERCVTQIGTLTKKECGTKWGQIVRSLLGGDLDYMAFKIRELSKGKEIEFSHRCTECGTKLKTIVSTDEFGIKPFMGQSVIDFNLPHSGYIDGKGQSHKEGQLRLPNGFDREIVVPQFKKNPSTATSLLLSRLVSFNDGALVTQKGITEMSLRDRKVLEDILKDNTFGLDTNIEIYCDTCGANLSGEVGQSNFF